MRKLGRAGALSQEKLNVAVRFDPVAVVGVTGFAGKLPAFGVYNPPFVIDTLLIAPALTVTTVR